jgi:origin recognition complex subunit 4
VLVVTAAEMSPDTTPSGLKRSRVDYDSELASPSPSSLKKRRLDVANNHSPSTPKALHAIASAISGAFGFSQKPSALKEVDNSYEVPVSDEEIDLVKHRNIPKKRILPLQKENLKPNGLYDVPDSGDELSTDNAPQPPQNRGSTPRSKGAAGRRSINGARRRKEALQGQEIDETLEISENDINESPTKQKSARKSESIESVKSVQRTVDTADATFHERDTRPVPKSSIRKRRNPLDELVIDGTAKLMSGWTPPRRDEEPASGSRKRIPSKKKQESDIYFEDLPKKSVQKKETPGRGRPTPTPKSKPKPKSSPKEVVESNEVADAEEDEEEVDEVCAICSKPDSKRPNLIIFCETCDMAVHQQCYGVPVIPKGDWFCKNCAQDGVEMVPLTQQKSHGTAVTAIVEEKIPEIPDFEHHLKSLQRVLLDRCTGRRRIKPRGQSEPYGIVWQLVEQTVAAGEGNSMLIIGARGSGKTSACLSASIIVDRC